MNLVQLSVLRLETTYSAAVSQICADLRERIRYRGVHYQKTSDAWLARLDRHRNELVTIFAAVYGKGEAQR